MDQNIAHVYSNKQNRNAIALILLILAQLACWKVLASDKSEINAIKQIANAKSIEVRVNAAKVLAHKDSQAAANALAQAMVNDQALIVRSHAAGGLWGHEFAEQFSDELWQATEDAPEVAVRAAGALKSIGIPSEQLVAAFRKGLQARGTASQFNGARGLIGIDDSESLLPYLLNHLQKQASKNNPSGIQAAAKAIHKLIQFAGEKFYPALLDGINRDQAGNHVVLRLFEQLPIETKLLSPHIIAASKSVHHLNRMAAGSLATRFADDNNVDLVSTIEQLFHDNNEAVIESVIMGCGQNNKHLFICEQQLKQLLNSKNIGLRTSAADALAGMSEHMTESSRSNGLTDELWQRALNDNSDDVRYDAIDAYISSDAADVQKAHLLATVALKESQAYIITFALSRLNRYKQHLDAEQKQRLETLKSHSDAEVRRIADLVL